MSVDLILGTAGHIDHGKTSLIRALTGVDTDRLPEEKQRGITIELGFAELDLDEFRLGIVDVPGHERFVRNMLAGATGTDLAMLVVAADDSVKPQTREHLDVLRLLDLPAGVIALTKCDLADSQWIALVEEEVRETVQDTFLADAPIVRTSSTSGEGLDQLRSALIAAARRASTSERASGVRAPFRMAIDRTFTVAGHGTVVTGSVSSGRTQIGDRLVIEPGAIEVRVRGLQNHDRTVEDIQRGQRAAINLAGVRHGQIRRGQELAAPGHLVANRLMTVQLQLLEQAPRPLKSRSRVRVHVGTAEVMASVSLLGTDRLQPGQTGWVQLFLAEEMVTTWNQPFVVRALSPVMTVGGGHILVPHATRIRQPKPRHFQQLQALTSKDPLTRASAAVYWAGTMDCRSEDLTRTAGIGAVLDVHAQLVKSGQLREIEVSPRRTLHVHQLVFEELCNQIETALEKAHAREPLRSMLDRSPFVQRLRYLGDDAVMGVLLTSLRDAGRIRLSERGIGLAGHGPRLSSNEKKLLDQLIQKYRDAGFQPPTVKSCKEQATKNRDAVESLIALAASDGDLIQITSDIYLHAQVEQQMRQQLAQKLETQPSLTVSQVREILGTSRKYAVPFCEYLDRVGFTRRQGDVRILNQSKSAGMDGEN